MQAFGKVGSVAESKLQIRISTYCPCCMLKYLKLLVLMIEEFYKRIHINLGPLQISEELKQKFNVRKSSL